MAMPKTQPVPKRVLHKLDQIRNNGNICITTWKMKNSVGKMLPPVSIEALDFWFQVWRSLFYINLTFACKTETLGSCSIDSNWITQVQKSSGA